MRKMTDNALISRLEETLCTPPGPLQSLDEDQQFERIASKVADMDDAIVSKADLLERLKGSHASGRPLRIKFGIDPTGPDIHIGHAVSLLNLRLFQRMGHQIILVIGDFTGMIGDPSGRVDARPPLTEEQMRANMATYEDQAARIIDLRDPTIERHYNSEWMSGLTVRDWVETLKRTSASILLQREDFRNRLAAGHGLSMAELEYALFMGYDSVVLNPDVELGGVDQFLNMHVCRKLMAAAGQKSEIIIAYNLLPGTTGEVDENGRLTKMSKSRGNYIPVTADPADMYGKVMAIPDDVMWMWFRELTGITPADLQTLKSAVNAGRVHPKDAKQLLSRAIVATFNGFDPRIVRAAEDDFKSKFGKASVLVPESTKDLTGDPQQPLIVALATATGKSKSEVRRLVEQNGVRMLKGSEYVAIDLPALNVAAAEYSGAVLRVGKLGYYRLVLAD
jgi:tyrosyl-tRNA synthetase